MGIRLTKQAQLDLSSFDSGTKAWLKEYILQLPLGDIRKLADFSNAFRLRVADFCIVFEEKPDRKARHQVAVMNREQMLALDAIIFVVMKIIPRPITWMEEIEAVRVGRDELKKGEVKNIEDVVWV
jgi:mRNA-degrading endonuclease RelE of RelBE toxin-antitoxin system